VEGRGEEWNTFSWGGSTNPPYSTINYLLERAGIKDMNNEEAQELCCNLGPRMMIVLLVVLNMCWGEVDDIMDWVGVISIYI
jgi:hypothetical protein